MPILTRCTGFGERSSWDDTRIPSPGHHLTFKETVRTVCHNLVIVLAVPIWAMGLHRKLRAARAAADEMHVGHTFIQ